MLRTCGDGVMTIVSVELGIDSGSILDLWYSSERRILLRLNSRFRNELSTDSAESEEVDIENADEVDGSWWR